MSYEQIWAPWRLAYLTQPSLEPEEDVRALRFLPEADRQCFLCQGVADPANPARRVVHHDQQTVTILNRYPYNNGHLLVAPRRHCARLDELAVEEQTVLVPAIARMIGLLERVLRPEGFNIGLNLGHAAGAGLPGHLHWHIVPRWSGDTNFMPSVASVKVIPQSLDDLQAALTEALREGA